MLNILQPNVGRLLFIDPGSMKIVNKEHLETTPTKTCENEKIVEVNPGYNKHKRKSKMTMRMGTKYYRNKNIKIERKDKQSVVKCASEKKHTIYTYNGV